MALLEHSKIFKVPVKPINEFAKGLKVSSPSIYYAIDNNLVDYITIGDRNLVVMTAKTFTYTPNKSTKRVKKKVVKRKAK